MKVGIVQFSPVFGAVARNIAKVVSLVKDKQADIWVLPELFATGYQLTDAGEASSLAEELDGPTVATMSAKAAQLGCFFCGGFPEKSGDRVFNSAFVAGPGGLVALYRKMHLFDREKLLFSPGDRGFKTFSVRGVHLGLMICFDWLFPEAARTLALKGAQVILHPCNLVLPHCPEAMKTRALENHVFTVTANRIGSESRIDGEHLAFIGQSTIWSPSGQRILSAGANDEGAFVVELDETLALDKRITERNDVLADRRPDFYAER